MLRRDRLSHHRAYAERYYAGEFVPGRGLERVLELLVGHGAGGSWLDLGAGPTTHRVRTRRNRLFGAPHWRSGIPEKDA